MRTIDEIVSVKPQQSSWDGAIPTGGRDEQATRQNWAEANLPDVEAEATLQDLYESLPWPAASEVWAAALIRFIAQAKVTGRRDELAVEIKRLRRSGADSAVIAARLIGIAGRKGAEPSQIIKLLCDRSPYLSSQVGLSLAGEKGSLERIRYWGHAMGDAHSVLEKANDKRKKKQRIAAAAATEQAALLAAVAEVAKKPNFPGDKACQAYSIRKTHSITNQTEVAREMTRQGTKATQGQVSKWLKEIDNFRASGTELTQEQVQAMTMDPATIDIGRRQDGRTPRQRGRKIQGED
jgi:hypothetical protein